MSDKRAIAKALKSKAQTGGAPSFPQGQNALTSYGAWNAGTAYGNQLPRDPSVFSTGAFGPLNPLQPIGIDTPQTDSGRPEPRRFQYPVAWNMPTGQPGSEGLKLVSFANLRMYADSYSVVRACIQVRKEEILGLDWDIVPTPEAQRKMQGDVKAHQDFHDRRQAVMNFFNRPDPNYHDFTGWLGAVLEDVFVIDALSLYMHPPRVKGKGILGSDLSALEVLDGSTIRPLLDIRGGTPRPPQPGYQQYLWGVPRTDLMDIILQSDIDEMDAPVAEYRADQLLYLPYNRRSWTPYGFPGIERAIIPVLTGLRRQKFQLEFFTEGSIPGQFVIPGEDISTPTQIRQLQDTLNAIAGDQAYKHKIIVLPRGSSTQPQKQIDLASQFDEQIVTTIAMAYDVMPMELGVSQGGAAGQTPNATNQMAQASAEINKRKALKPMLQWLKSAIFDHVIQDIIGQDDMQWAWVGLETADDAAAEADNHKTLVSIGLESIDEARVSMGKSPWGLPMTSEPILITATGASTLGTIDPATAEAYFNSSPIAPQESLASQPTGTPIASNAAAATAPTSTAPASTPAASVGTPGVGGRPVGGGGKAPSITPPTASSPMNSTVSKAVEKAQLAEFDALRRFLKKGRDIDTWTYEHISSEALDAVKNSLRYGADITKAITRGKEVMKSADRLARRADAVQTTASNVVSRLGALAGNIYNAQVGPIKFIDLGVHALRDGYIEVMNAAAQHAAVDHTNVSPVIPGGFHQIATDRAERQRNFLTGMAQDLVAGQSDAKVAQRLNMYSQSLRPAYEQAYGLSVLTGQAIGNEYVPTDLTDTEVELDDVPTDQTATGGAGIGLSSLVELAGAAAAAYIIGSDIMSPEGDMTGSDTPTDFAEQPRSTIIWHVSDDDPCPLCEERDGQAYTLDTLPCWPGDGGFDEFCEGAGNCKCYLEYLDPDDPESLTAGNPISDYTNPFYDQRAAEETMYDQAATDARAADIASVAETNPEAAARMEARDMLYGVPGTRYGPDGKFDPFGDVTASATVTVYKSLDPHVFSELEVYDLLVNETPEIASLNREGEDNGYPVAIIKGLTSNVIRAGTALQVVSISENEIELEAI